MAATKRLAQQFARVFPMRPGSLQARRLSAREPSTPQEELSRLYANRSLHRELAQNPNLPYGLLLSLFERFPREVFENPAFALMCLERPELVRRLSLGFARGALLREVPGALLQLLAERSVWCGDAASLVRYPNLKAETLRLLFAQGVATVEMARHPNTPEDLLQGFMLQEVRSLREAAARHPRAPKATLSLLRRGGFSLWLGREPKRFGLLEEREYGPLLTESDYIAGLIARSALTPEPILVLLSKHPSASVRQKVAGSAVLPVGGAELLLKDQDVAVRRALAQNLTTPANLLCEAARDVSPTVRLAVAKHRYIPREALRFLSSDKDGAVRDAAMSHPKFPRASKR